MEILAGHSLLRRGSISVGVFGFPLREVNAGSKREKKIRPHRLWLCSHYNGWLLVPRKAIRNGVNAALLSPCPLKPMLRSDRRALFSKNNGVFIAKYFSTPIPVTDSTPIYRRNNLLAALKTWSELCLDYE